MRQLFIAALLGLCFTGTAFAGNVDMKVDLTGPTQANTGAALSYNLALRNLGNQNAQNVVAMISIPSGAQVSSVSSPCAVLSTQVRCAYSSQGGGVLRNIGLALVAPASAGTITLVANVTTSSRDSSASNNSDSHATLLVAPPPPPPSTIVLAGDNDLHIVQCSGSGPLVFANCVPGSRQYNDFLLLADHTIEVPEPGYDSVWSQPTTSQLQMTFTELTSGNVEAVYNGQAVSATCFEGTMSYPQLTGWYGAFRACLVP